MEAQQKGDVERKLQPGALGVGKKIQREGGRARKVRKGWWKVERQKVEPSR